MKSVNVNMIPVQVVDEGQGEPVLFVHGFPLDGRLWQRQVAAFRTSHRVLVPDLPGFGQTPHPEETTKFRMEDYAQVLHGVLEGLGVAEPVTLVGLSMGGYIAFAYHRLYPQKVKRLGLLHTRAVADTSEAAKGRHDTAAKVLVEGMGVLEAAMMPKLLAKDAAPDVVELTKKMIHQTSRAGAAAALRGMADRPDVRSDLGQIKVPALVLSGEFDAISPPAEMEEISKALPHAAFVVIPGSGHLSPLEKPAELNQALAAWLQ